MQLEIPMAEVGALARRARARGARVILNAAPAAAPPGEILEAVDVFAVNRIEAGTLARALGIEAAEPEEAASRLAREIGRPVVVTLGARGAAAFGAGPDIRVGALRSRPVIPPAPAMRSSAPSPPRSPGAGRSPMRCATAASPAGSPAAGRARKGRCRRWTRSRRGSPTSAFRHRGRRSAWPAIRNIASNCSPPDSPQGAGGVICVRVMPDEPEIECAVSLIDGWNPFRRAKDGLRRYRKRPGWEDGI